MSCACKGIRHCAKCENLEETKERIQKYKRPDVKPLKVDRFDYDFGKPQLDGITVVENFISEMEEEIIINRMDSGTGKNSTFSVFFTYMTAIFDIKLAL